MNQPTLDSFTQELREVNWNLDVCIVQSGGKENGD